MRNRHPNRPDFILFSMYYNLARYERNLLYRVSVRLLRLFHNIFSRVLFSVNTNKPLWYWPVVEHRLQTFIAANNSCIKNRKDETFVAVSPSCCVQFTLIVKRKLLYITRTSVSRESRYTYRNQLSQK